VTTAEIRLTAMVREDRERTRPRLFRLSDCEAYIGRDDTGGRYEGTTGYTDLSDCADDYDWSHLAAWADYAESSDCVDPTIY
jgi:hypothetical protein